jgi:hypothetical protein
VYFAEKDSEEKWSFFDSFWWGLMVLTTVGYGATAPSTVVGKVICRVSFFLSGKSHEI